MEIKYECTPCWAEPDLQNFLSTNFQTILFIQLKTNHCATLFEIFMFQFRLCRLSQSLAVLARITVGECWKKKKNSLNVLLLIFQVWVRHNQLINITFMFPRPEQPSINLSRLVTKCVGIHCAQTRTEPSLTLVGHLGSSQKGLPHSGINFLSEQVKLVFRLITNSSFGLWCIPSPMCRSPCLSLRMKNNLLQSPCCCSESRRFYPGLSGSDTSGC